MINGVPSLARNAGSDKNYISLGINDIIDETCEHQLDNNSKKLEKKNKTEK